MDKLNEAIIFATEKHQNSKRKLTNVPFILHPLEACVIASTMTLKEDILVTAVLHDVIEDEGVSVDEIREKFGDRVALYVNSETEKRYDGQDMIKSWKERKENSLSVLKNTSDIYVKILWLSDKLSNIRSINREYQKNGESIWLNFHQNDKLQHEWYYRKVAEYTEDLKDFDAYKEYVYLVNKIFK